MTEIPLDLVPLGIVFGHGDGPIETQQDWLKVETLTATIDEAFCAGLRIYGRRPGATERKIVTPADYEIDWLAGPSVLRAEYYCEVRARRRGLSDFVGPWRRSYDADIYEDLAIAATDWAALSSMQWPNSSAHTIVKSKRGGGKKPGSGSIDDKEALLQMRALLMEGKARSNREAATMVASSLGAQHSKDATIQRLRKKYGETYDGAN